MVTEPHSPLAENREYYQPSLSNRNKNRSLLAIISVLNYLRARILRKVTLLAQSDPLLAPAPLARLDFMPNPCLRCIWVLKPNSPLETQPFVQTFHQPMSDLR